jgi:hypothetical protein
VIESEDARETFEQKWCGAPVAMRGVRLQAREQGGDPLAGALTREVVEAVAERFLPMLIVSPDSAGVVRGRLRGTSLWLQRLTVRFPDGTINDAYNVLLGVAAFHAHAELQGYFRLKDRLKPDAIIL